MSEPNWKALATRFKQRFEEQEEELKALRNKPSMQDSVDLELMWGTLMVVSRLLSTCDTLGMRSERTEVSINHSRANASFPFRTVINCDLVWDTKALMSELSRVLDARAVHRVSPNTSVPDLRAYSTILSQCAEVFRKLINERREENKDVE